MFTNLSEAVKLTVLRILEIDGVPSPECNTISMEMKFGYDGSGGHKIYNQQINVNTNNTIMAMFCPLKITENGNIIWEQEVPNSEFSQRPLLIQMGKESHENLQSLAQFNEDIKSMESLGIDLTCHNKEINLKVNVAANSLDRKASNIYQGILGNVIITNCSIQSFFVFQCFC